jgi:serine/threonine protein kinase
MSFAAPEGTTFVRLLGGGSVFEVALVRGSVGAEPRSSRRNPLRITAGELMVCKRLVPIARSSREGRAAMGREARLLSMTSTGVLPRLIDVGSDVDGPFFLQTFVEGTSVRGLVEAWGAEGRWVPPTLIRHVAVLGLEALVELHTLADAQGPLDVVHGDMAPDHVLLGPRGEVRFVDLGACRFRGMEPTLGTDDRGTVPYAPPEVVRGEAQPDQASDVYSFAATLLYLATGEPLCEARTEAAMIDEIGSRGLSPAIVDRADAFGPAARDALRAAIDPDPARRLASALALRDALLL